MFHSSSFVEGNRVYIWKMMRVNLSLAVFAAVIITLTHVDYGQADNRFFPKAPIPQKQKVVCTSDSLIIYFDCRVCFCPKPNRLAKCLRKSCDLRTKDSGQCPPAMLRLDDSKLCPRTPNPSCATDVDCSGNQLCCFDFCGGAQCVNPVPLDPGMPIHGGRGYP